MRKPRATRATKRVTCHVGHRADPRRQRAHAARSRGARVRRRRSPDAGGGRRRSSPPTTRPASAATDEQPALAEGRRVGCAVTRRTAAGVTPGGVRSPPGAAGDAPASQPGGSGPAAPACGPCSIGRRGAQVVEPGRLEAGEVAARRPPERLVVGDAVGVAVDQRDERVGAVLADEEVDRGARSRRRPGRSARTVVGNWPPRARSGIRRSPRRPRPRRRCDRTPCTPRRGRRRRPR